MPEIEAGITKRRILAGLEDVPWGEEPIKKARPVRKVVAAGGGDRGGQDDATGFMAWKVSQKCIADE
jgi:bromodomain adjacent to zinc finger domain protein 1A